MLDLLLPIYSALMGIIIPLAVGYGLRLLKERTGIQIEASDRAALQSAIANAAVRAIALSGGAAYTNIVTDTAVSAGVELVRQGAGEAMERFGLDEATIRARIQDQAMAAILSVPTVGRPE